MEYHLKKCKYTLIECPNKCKDERKRKIGVKRMDLSHHLKEECPNRKYDCKLCGIKGMFRDLVPSHEQNCPRRKVDCPNSGCGKSMECCLWDDHIAECDYAVNPCEVCGMQLKKKDLEGHKQGDKHHEMHKKTSLAIAQLKKEADVWRLVLIVIGVLCALII